jgi:DNA-binding NtrC family response regulator
MSHAIRRILVVDDEDAIQFSYKRLLQGAFVEVDACGSLEEAISMIMGTDYDVVMADLRLSHSEAREGLDILEHIRQYKPATPVILMTGYGSSEIKEKALALGVVKYFVKPVQVSELIEFLTKMGFPVGKI